MEGEGREEEGWEEEEGARSPVCVRLAFGRIM